MFGKLHRTRKTPLNAMLLQATLTIMFILVGGGFRSLINFSVVASWSFYFLTVGLHEHVQYVEVHFLIGSGPSDFAYKRANAGKVGGSVSLYLLD